MKRLLCLLASVAVSCAPSFSPPDPLERELIGAGDPEPTTTTPWVADAGPVPERPDAGPCCVVRFAIAAGADDLGASLYGSRAPLLEPVPLTRDGGAWAVDVCMPLETQGYFFEVYLPADGEDAGPFPLRTANTRAPNTIDPVLGAINVFQGGSATSCAALDAGVYGVTGP